LRMSDKSEPITFRIQLYTSTWSLTATWTWM
jgi:hypothetical protein